jgi:hypothetical protein
MEDDIGLVHGVMEDVSKDLLQRYGMIKEEMYVRVDKELKGIQQAIQVSRAIPIVSSSSEIVDLGDEPSQLRILVDEIEARIQ